MKTLGFLLATLLLSGVHAGAASLSESFSSRADFAGGTAVWNQALGKIHPTLRAMNYENPTPPPPIDVSIGDGSDGVFDNTTYANFSVGGDVSGQIIRLDTNAHPTLKVTSFTLDQGWKIIPVGTNPLIIESLSTVKILGEIHCEGEDGGASIGAAIGLGGAGHCGGMNGGDGGLANGTGADGVDASATVTGGHGGSYIVGTSTAVGGGGGGSWSSASAPTNGPNSTGNNGKAGLFQSDREFTTQLGGAGGGGGSGDAATAGGGGGAGGGVVIIHAVGDVEVGQAPASAFGFIFAGGGKGGDASGFGAAGGGGGGGSVQIFAGGFINLYNTDIANGSSQAPGGASGTNASSTTGAFGGLGRSWILTTNGVVTGGGTYSPPEETDLVTGFPGLGEIQFHTATQNVVTRSFDTANNLATISALTLAPVSSDFMFEVSGSSDNFVSDDTGWTTNAALVADKRYLKMRLSITTSNVYAPDMIDTAIIDYALGSQDSFAFKSAGCGRVDGGGSPVNLLMLILPLVFLSGLKIQAKRRLARERVRVRS